MIQCDDIQTGYGSFAYVESLSEFGEPVLLPKSGGALLKRTIPGSMLQDAMGGYPLSFCDDWSALHDDLENLPDQLVSVSMVADPFGAYSLELLEDCFDVVNPFKCHYIVDLNRPSEDIGTRSHRKHARRAFKDIHVEVCREPASCVEEWSMLYRNLRKRYGINGVRGFSKNAFKAQLAMPGVTVLQAFCQHRLVGAQIYFQLGDVVHCHLGAVNDMGYSRGAFYAMDAFSFNYFSDRAEKLDLGGGAGLTGGADDGLSLYKKGWSSETQPVYFCGRIINTANYAKLAGRNGRVTSSYFPAYRAGEFA